MPFFSYRFQKGIVIVTLLQVCLTLSAECPSFRLFFSKCSKGSSNFDNCILKALNKATSCYKYGDESLNIPVLEPIRYGDFIPPVAALISSNFFTLNMTLNITEWGWGSSVYTKVKTDFAERKLVLYQTVPFKHVNTEVSGHGTLFGLPFEERKGYAILDMIGVKQRFTIQMLPNSDELRVKLVILSVKKMKLSLHGLLLDPDIEKITNVYLERLWRFVYSRFITEGYDFSNKAKTELGNRLYKMIDFDNLFKPAPSNL